ncbi:unnamed protein product [Dracunculus medinensis]|uniref:Uncharacterized protein n=1 Tax=Dracunculus medinensis TaxID=318479 RepID=A0A0N4U7G2_DRAME|nr:unnamed protein product [Dracunculus medinensis]
MQKNIKIKIKVKMFVYYLIILPYRKFLNRSYRCRPLSSNILKIYIRSRSYPSWTSFFLPYKEVQDDFYSEKYFNIDVDGNNYQILRIGCFPFIKFHCTKNSFKNLTFENYFFKFLTVLNFGIPCLLYGIIALFFIKHTEYIFENKTKRKISIHFLIKEDHN